MNIVRKIHDQFRVKTVAGAQLETPEAVSSQGVGGSTFITITGGGGTSLSGSGLSKEDRVKLDSIEQGAQVNQDAFSKIQFNATSIDGNDQSSSSNSSIIANVPTDTANIKIVGNYPITVNLESVSLFNSNTSTTTGTVITTYNISFDDSNNIVIEYVDGTLLNVADVELIQVKHKEDVLATYQLSDITYTTSDGTITSFTIPYSNTDFSEIDFCKYETVTTETEEGSTTVRELRVLSILPASPTKQSIITLNSLTDSFWNYEEDENGNKFVWTDYNVYSTKDVSAYGRGTDLGNAYASNLYELKDVVLTNLSNNDLLIYNSSTGKWVNINKDQLGASVGQLHTLTISVNGVTQTTYNPAQADASINISTLTLDEVTEYINQKIDTKLDTSEFFKWFTINYDSDNNVVSIQANFDFYSIGEVSAYGLGEGEEEPSCISSLGELSDVTLTDVALNNILLYDGSKWVNKPMSSIVVDAYTKSEIDTKLSSISGHITNIQSSIATINNSISDITSDISTINTTISDIQTALADKLDKDDFFTWFTIIKNTSGEVVSIQANFDFYSIGGVSAYGLGDIGGSGRTTLATLDDVSLSNLVVNDMLTYNGSEWINIPMSQVRGVTSWDDLEDKPTTLSGYGITDVYTKTQVDSKISVVSNKLDDFLTGSDTDTIINKWKELESFLAGYTQTQTLAELLSVKANSSVKISAGTGLTGGGDLTEDRTLSLDTSGVTAGTYTKVTVDVYGRVTSGSTLSASDIPNLDWSKITSGKPTTLEGYGITDGVNSVTITGKGNAITTATITDHILTLTKGNTFLQQSIFDDLFEKVNIGTTSDPIYAIKAKYHFYSVGEVSAYEFSDASSGDSGASALYQLNDVATNSTNNGVLGAATGKVLMYNGSKWQAGSVVTDISTLTLQINGSALATFDGKSNVVANIAVPTKLSQLTDDVVSGKYLPLSGGLMTGQIRKNGVFSSWIKGRDNAMIRTSSLNGYSVMASIKTTNGTWEIGAYDQSSYFDDLIFSYCTDTNYSNNNNATTAQIRFFENGTIGASITGNAFTATALTSSAGSSTIPIYFSSGKPVQCSTTLGVSITGNAKTATDADTVDGYHESSFAKIAAPNNLIHSGNEFTFVPSNFSGTVWFNYRTTGETNGAITEYIFGNGAGGALASISDGQFSGNASTASKWQSARTLTLTGSVTGSVSIDGSANISMATTTNHTHTFASLTSKPTTISGYGITDAITKKFIIERNDFQHYVILLCKIGANSTKTPHTINGTIWSHHDGALRYQAAYVNIHCSDWTTSYNNYYNFTPFGIGTKCRLVTCKYKTFKYLAIAYTNTQACTIFFDGSYSNIDFTPVLYYTSDTKTINNSEIYNSIEDVEYNKLAFTSDNVASATQLQTSRTLWGQPFNGTANVSGTLTGVGGIYMTDSIYNANNHNVLNCTSSFLILGYGSSANGYDTYLDGKTLYLRSGTAHNLVMTITSSGYVGIGTTNPSSKLYVDGNIAATGEITAYSSSDIRLKTNLNKLNSLPIIRKLGVYSFDWNEEALQLRVNKNIHDYGLIAQQVQQYIPEVINTNMFDKGYLGIDYQRLIPFTISAIKEVDDEVTKLKKRVKQLERRLQKYESTEVFYTKGND